MKYLFPFIMSMVFLSILVGANFYLSRKFGWIFSLENVKWLHVLFAIIPMFMLGGLIGFSNATSSFGSLLYGLAAILTGVILYLLLALLFMDLIHVFIKLKPLVFGFSAITLTLLISAYGLWNATNTKLTQIDQSTLTVRKHR